MKFMGKISVLAVLIFSALNIHLHAQSITISSDRKEYKTSDEVVVTLTGELNDFTQYASLPDVPGLTLTDTERNFDNSAPGKKIRIRQTFRYIANQTGEFEIGPAVIYSGTRQYYSNTITINVAQDSRFEQEGLAFIRAEIPDRKFFIGERIPVYLRVYFNSKYSCETSAIFAERYDGFWHPDVPGYFDQSQKKETVVTINGREYKSRIFAVDYIYPNASGKLKLPEYVTTAVLTENSGGYDPFASSIDLSSRMIPIEVIDLPQHDSLPGYNGDIGQLNFEYSLSNGKTEEWNPVRMKVTVSGKTNFSMMIAPSFTLPDGFRMELIKSYDSLSLDDIESSSKIFEYNLIAEKQGNYTLNTIAYSYFDPEKSEYITIQGDTLTLTVAPGTKIDPDSESNLPDTFLTAKSRLPFAIVVVLGVVLLSITSAYVIIRLKKKAAAKTQAEKVALEKQEPEYVAPADTSAEQAFAMLNTAKLILRNGQCSQSIDTAYQALLIRISALTKLKPHEVSAHNLKYKLSKLYSDLNLVNAVVSHLEDLKLRKYSIKGSEFELAGQLIQRTEQLLIQLK